MTVKDRILTFIESTGVKKGEFFNKFGLAPSNFRGQSKQTGLNSDTIVRILTEYPQLSVEWLMAGRGEMLKTNRPSERISKSEAANSHSKVTDNPQTLQATGEEIVQEPAVSYNPAVGKPYYDVDFIGGFDEIFNSQVSVPENNIVVRGFEKADLWCNVTGHSMEPKICHGDIIALRKCTIDDVQYGEIYAVVLDTMRTIKILRRSSNPGYFRYVPINTDDYDEQEFPKSRILHIYEVIGSISKFF